MALRDIVPQKRTIDAGGGVSFDVRGLTIDDISILIGQNREEVTTLFSGRLTPAELLVQAPGFMAKMIAFAAGEADQEQQVRSLPMQIQMRALEAVWEMTVFDQEELVKQIRDLVGGLQKFVAQVEPAMAKIPTPKTVYKVGGKKA